MSRVSGFYNINEVSVITGLNKEQIYYLFEHGLFPQPIRRRHGSKGLLWNADDVDKWLEKETQQ